MTGALSIAHRAIASASRIVFHETEFQIQLCAVIGPRLLITLLSNERHDVWAVRSLAIIALFDGLLEKEKIDFVLEYAAALDVRGAYPRQFSEAARGNLPWALADMTRQNIKSLWDQPWNGDEDVMASRRSRTEVPQHSWRTPGGN